MLIYCELSIYGKFPLPKLWISIHNFGANANARGSAVFCYHLNNGKHTRFERHEVLGVVKELPDWAKERLAAVKSQMTAEHAKSKKDRGDAR